MGNTVASPAGVQLASQSPVVAGAPSEIWHRIDSMLGCHSEADRINLFLVLVGARTWCEVPTREQCVQMRGDDDVVSMLYVEAAAGAPLAVTFVDDRRIVYNAHAAPSEQAARAMVKALPCLPPPSDMLGAMPATTSTEADRQAAARAFIDRQASSGEMPVHVSIYALVPNPEAGADATRPVRLQEFRCRALTPSMTAAVQAQVQQIRQALSSIGLGAAFQVDRVSATASSYRAGLVGSNFRKLIDGSAMPGLPE